MSLKDDVDYIKKEISAEESYMENFFKVEKLFKKYKITIIAITIIIVVSVIGFYVSSYISDKNKLQANVALNTLLKNPNDKEALAVLEVKNKKLYEIYQYRQDDTKVIDVKYFKELALYTNAIKENSLQKLNNVTQKQEFLLKDFAIFNKALIQAQEKKYAEAKETLQLISDKSEVSPLGKMLEHFLLTK
jgi:hypothetical protein